MAKYNTFKYGNEKYGTGSASDGSLSEVASTSPVKINGRGYVIDLNKFQRRSSIDQRAAIDFGAQNGEQAYPSGSRWHRARSAWHGGEGQYHADRPDSDPERYYAGEGISVSGGQDNERRYISLSHPIIADYNVNNVFGLEVFGTQQAAITWDGVNIALYYGNVDDTDMSNLAITTLMSEIPTHTTTDGTTVWYPDDNGIAGYNPTAGAIRLTNAVPPDLLGYVAGRLIATKRTDKNKLYEVDPSGTFTEFAAHPSTDMVWSNPISAPNGIYLVGTNNLTSSVYKIDIESTDSSLRPPYQVAEMPPGEVIKTLHYIAGMMLIGTTKGVRLATIDGSRGYLTYGPNIPDIPGGGGIISNLHYAYVLCDNLTYTDLGGSSVNGVGVKRLDLRTFTEPLVPISETYLIGDTLPAGAGGFNQIAHDGSRLKFTAGNQMYGESDLYGFGETQKGHVHLGQFDFGRPLEDKTITKVKVNTSSLYNDGTEYGRVKVRVADQSRTVTTILTHENGESGEANVSVTGKSFEVEVELESTGLGPATILYDIQFEAIAAPDYGEIIVLPVILHDTVQSHTHDGEIAYDAWVEYKLLKSLMTKRTLVDVGLGDQTLKGYIQDIIQQEGDVHDWVKAGNSDFLQGTYGIVFEAVADVSS